MALNRFSSGQQALVSRLKLTAGRSLKYTYGTIANVNGQLVYTATATVPLTGWVGRTLFALANPEPGKAAVAWGDRDYMIDVADFVLAIGTGIEPIKGDRITDTDDQGNTIVYEVQIPTGTNEPVWRYSDQTRQVYRIHTKRVLP